MAINPDLLKILVCPTTKLPLYLATADQLLKINQQIESSDLHNVSGNPVTSKLEAALIRQDQKLIYPIIKEIPVLLNEEAIPVK